MKDHLEIERKFLLKKVPYFDKVKDSIIISQYYLPSEKGITRRIRKSTSKNKTKYYFTEKKKISAGVAHEKENTISKEKFFELLKTATKEIHKIRTVYRYKKLNWEVDMFTSINLIMCEVELKRRNERISIPPEIAEVFIREVTNFKEFSNQNLATKVHK